MVVNTSSLLVKTQNELDLKKTELDLKTAENEGMSSRIATSDRELASLRSTVEQSERIRENFAELARDAEEREKQSLSENERLRGENAALQSSVEAAKQRAIDDFLQSTEFDAHCCNELLPYYYQGRNHVLRMASADGIAVDQLVSWASASHYGARARSQHGVVEFSEDELISAREEDAENGLEPWVPPPVLPNTVNQLADHLKAGGGAKYENGVWTLSDPPADDKAGPSS